MREASTPRAGSTWASARAVPGPGAQNRVRLPGGADLTDDASAKKCCTAAALTNISASQAGQSDRARCSSATASGSRGGPMPISGRATAGHSRSRSA